MRRLEWSIARRYLKGGRRGRLASLITFIATGGVIVGVFALVVVMGVMNGLQTELRSRILSMTSHAAVSGYEAGFEDWEGAREVALGDARVVAAAPDPARLGAEPKRPIFFQLPAVRTLADPFPAGFKRRKVNGRKGSQ